MVLFLIPQVGLFVTEPSLIKLLNEIATTADTCNDAGRRYMLAGKPNFLLISMLVLLVNYIHFLYLKYT